MAIGGTWYSAMPLNPLKTCCNAVGWTVELALASYLSLLQCWENVVGETKLRNPFLGSSEGLKF